MSRYLEKNYLCKYDLDADFFYSLGLEVYNVIPLRKVYILNTNKGDKVIKRVEYDEERIEFINWCTENISEKTKNKFTINELPNGKRYYKWKDDKYILMDLVVGREVTFSNPIELKKAVNLLANIHKESAKIINELVINKDEKINKWLGENLIDKYNKEIKDLENIYYWVKKYKYKNEIDNIFLDNVQDYINEMVKAKELLLNSKYMRLRTEFNNMVICHNDLAEHNYLINNEDVTLIDFDYVSIDMRFMDISDILVKGIKDVDFEFEKAIDVIYEYDSINKINSEEYKLIYISLLYPKASYCIFKDYYHKLKSWDEEVFLNRIKNKVIRDKYRMEFVCEYNKLFNIE